MGCWRCWSFYSLWGFRLALRVNLSQTPSAPCCLLASVASVCVQLRLPHLLTWEVVSISSPGQGIISDAHPVKLPLISGSNLAFFDQCGWTFEFTVKVRPNTKKQGITGCHTLLAWVCFFSYNLLLFLGKSTQSSLNKLGGGDGQK